MRVFLRRSHCLALCTLLLTGCLVLGGFCPALGQENQGYDQVLEGFGDESGESESRGVEDVLEGFEDDGGTDSAPGRTDRVPESSDEAWLSAELDGYAKLRSVYNFAHKAPDDTETDWRGVSSLRAELLLALDCRLGPFWRAKISGKGFYDAVYDLKGRDEYTEAVRDDYSNELALRDTYIQGPLWDRLDVKAGRQIVVWGKSDNIRVTDVLNPLDLREPGTTDIEDLRLPVGMLKLDYYLGDWNLSALAIPEIRFDKRPPFGSDFYPGDSPAPHEDTPESGLDNMEYALALNGIFTGWDLSVYAADIYNDTPHTHLDDTQVLDPGPPAVVRPIVSLKHARLKMLGAAFNIAMGNWLLKSEAAHFWGLEFFNAPDETFQRTDVMAGLEYAGITDVTLSLEAVDRYLHDFDEGLEKAPDNAERHNVQVVARLSRDWLNQTLNTTLLVSVFGADFGGGAYERFLLEYDLPGAMDVGGGLVLYQPGDRPEFEDIDDNDRVFVEVKYSF